MGHVKAICVIKKNGIIKNCSCHIYKVYLCIGLPLTI